MTDKAVREIKDENGVAIARVWEENPGTMLRCLKCQLADGPKELIEYPETWRKLSDRKLYALCRAAGGTA
jgi:hypothetical protein